MGHRSTQLLFAALRALRGLAAELRLRNQLCCFPTLPPVDTAASATHFVGVPKKPSKVQEAVTPYPAKKLAKAAAPESGPRFADLAKVKASNAKLVQVHRTVLQKLAQ